jgi:Tol biopolymer transport system component
MPSRASKPPPCTSATRVVALDHDHGGPRVAVLDVPALVSVVTMKPSRRVASVARTHCLRLKLLTVVLLVAGFAVGAALGQEGSGAAVGTILFQSARDGNLEIYTMRADGTGVVRLTTNRARDVVPAWSPDGRKIAFTSNRDGNRELYVMNADGSEQRRLTHDPARDLFPTWSPDGHRIAFVRESKPGTFAGPIHVVNADGSGERKLTKTRDGDCCLAWSPSGEWIAYVSDDLEIYLLQPGGTGKKRLTSNKAGDCCPAWSPDGKRIAFASNRKGGGGKYRIYVMNAHGTGQRQVSSLLSIRPAFSPDGRRLAFEGLPPSAPLSNKSTEIFVINDTGGGQRRLTRNTAEDAFPSWRPSK